MLLVGCGSDAEKGTCEIRFDESSKDQSIVAGEEVCLQGWVADRCSEAALSAVARGLKTSGYTFTKSATCIAKGYKHCDSGVEFWFERSCEPPAPPPAPAPSVTPDAGAVVTPDAAESAAQETKTPEPETPRPKSPPKKPKAKAAPTKTGPAPSDDAF